MDFRPDMDAHSAAKKRQYARQRKRAKIILITLLCIMILAVWALIGVTAYFLSQNARPNGPAITTSASDLPPVTTAPVTTEAPVTTAPVETETVIIEREQLARGSLILVSSMLGRAYDFSIEDTFTTLYGNKPNSYRIANTSLKLHPDTLAAANAMFDAYKAETGNRDYQITQAARTFDQQKAIYDDYLVRYGAEEGAMLAAQPGYSEHHAGYAFDMNVYTEDGISYSLASAKDVNPIYGWIYDNAARYGFVQRYPENKTSVTGITNEPWHFRYVGTGHAAYMAENGLTLEEYIALLYKHPYDKEHLTFSYDGVAYEVFFVPFTSDAEAVEISLPVDCTYTVSGNNWDGVIITITRS